MDKLKLWFGEDFKIFDELKIKNPKLSEIMLIGEEKYFSYISTLTLEPINIADILWDNYHVWYEDIKSWDLFINNYYLESQDDNKIISESLKFFTGLEFVAMINESTGEKVLYNESKKIKINEFTFNLIVQYLKKLNFITEPEIYYQLKNSGSKGTAKYILKQISKKRKISEKTNIDLQSICSSLTWKSGIGNELLDFSIYKIYEGYARLNAIDNWDKTVTAYYAGTIDTEKQKINLQKINWSNILNEI